MTLAIRLQPHKLLRLGLCNCTRLLTIKSAGATNPAAHSLVHSRVNPLVSPLCVSLSMLPKVLRFRGVGSELTY